MSDITTITPRRRRTIICPSLRVNKQSVPWEKWKWLEGALKWNSKARKTGLSLECTKRPSVELEADWVTDMCTSSWCRGCVFLQEAA